MKFARKVSIKKDEIKDSVIEASACDRKKLVRPTLLCITLHGYVPVSDMHPYRRCHAFSVVVILYNATTLTFALRDK